jgi:energy-coupling factor transporter transmembrane protein EcfT
MKLKSFDESIHSVILLVLTIIGIVYFFIISNFIYYLPVAAFLLVMYFINDVSLRKIIKGIVIGIVLSFFCAYFILLFPNEKIPYDVLLKKQTSVFIRVGTISIISYLSLFAINFEKIMIYLLKKKKISANYGYPLLLAFSSVSQLKSEMKKIKINARLRNLPWQDRVNVYFPLLVYAIRHADRGAMALITRGLNEDKYYYFEIEIKTKDQSLLSFGMIFILICGFISLSL